MNIDQSVLREIGLTDTEIKVYLALLQLGNSTRGRLVAESKIVGSKIYDTLERLKEKGLASSYLESGVQHFKPITPKQIIAYLDKKKKQIDEMETKVNAQLPALLALFDQTREDQEVELLSGLQGLEVIFNDQVELLEKGDTCYVIGGTRGSHEEAVVAFFEKIHVMRNQKGIVTKMLFNQGQEEFMRAVYTKEKYPTTETRFIQHTSPVAINIYADYTVIIIFGQKISAIKIKSKDVAQSFIEYFNLLWNSAE